MSIRSKARSIRAIGRETRSFAKGYQELRRSNTTPIGSFYSLRNLYCLTNGRFNDAASWALSLWHPPTERPPVSSILGDVRNASVTRIVHDIETNGFHVFDSKIPAKTIDSLREFAETVPCQPILDNSKERAREHINEPVPYRDHPVEAPKYDIAQSEIFANTTVQQLLMDQGLHCVAQAFLRCSPILDLLAMWWSRPFQGSASSEAAQLYHFDMDRIKFLKFFFYLTEVTPESGPHCYVRGSSKRKPRTILRDGRIPDEEIHRHYPQEAITEICGEAGSVIAVDTRGWHKGKAVSRGERLILQVEYANSMFGQNYPKVVLPKDANSPFREFVYSHPRMFQGIVNV